MTSRQQRRHRTGRLGALSVFGALVLAACEVKNPGAILDTDLNHELVMTALVAGMSGDASVAVDDLAFLIARASDEMTGSGSYGSTGLLRRGIVGRDDVNGDWAAAQRARWVAEQGIERMKTVLGDDFDGNRLTARAYFFAGLAARLLGEGMCEVTFDGGPNEPNTKAFERAIPHFQATITHATQSGATDTAITNLITAAHGALAQVYLGLADWTNAAAEAALVPTTFVYNARYSDNSGRENNETWLETHNRPEMSVYGTYAGSLSPQDPRAPYRNCVKQGGCRTTVGADGLTEHWRQQKYPSRGSEIPIVKGTEMRLVQAEVRLVANDATSVTDAMGFINQVRARHGLGNLTAANINEAWQHLDHERHLTLWLEGRRWHDLRRWDAAGLTFLDGVKFVYGEPTLVPPVYAKATEIAKRATCIPISQRECETNPNVSCQ